MEPRSRTAILRVRVTPRAGAEALAGWRDGVLQVKLAAPPVDSKANAALVRFLAGVLGVTRSAIHLTHGSTARSKQLVVDGLDAATVYGRLGRPPD